MIGDLSAVDFMPGHAYVLARRSECMPEDIAHLHAWVKRLEARTAFDRGISTCPAGGQDRNVPADWKTCCPGDRQENGRDQNN